MNKVRLPNDDEIFCINPAEAELLYEDIYRDRSYLQHGICIRDTDCILDVGANIGLFTLFASQQAAALQLYVFEPLPPIFEVLSANLRRHGVAAHLFPCGLAAEARVARFAYYERNSAMSGQFWDQEQEKQTAKIILGNKHPDLSEYLDELVGRSFVPAFFECPLRTLSDVIVECGLSRIDLLKIDVEKSELEVMRGIEASHWPMIRQIVLEVHDIEDRVRIVKQLLESHDFTTTVVQNTHFQGTGLYDVYACRSNA